MVEVLFSFKNVVGVKLGLKLFALNDKTPKAKYFKLLHQLYVVYLRTKEKFE